MLLPALPWVHDDGGRAAAGYADGPAQDCVCRAISIATRSDYDAVYRALADALAAEGLPRSARNGVPRRIYGPFLEDLLGWTWTPTMSIGSGCRVHLRQGELPEGRLVVQVSQHLTAVLDGVIHDTYDPTREGTRCVYGYYWRNPC